MIIVLTDAEKTLWDAGGDWKQGFLKGIQKAVAEQFDVTSIMIQYPAGTTLLSAVRETSWAVV